MASVRGDSSHFLSLPRHGLETAALISADCDGARDRQSFDEVVLPHLDAAYRLARWLMRNEDDAEDVVQEAALRAFRYFRTFPAEMGGPGSSVSFATPAPGWRGHRFHALIPTRSTKSSTAALGHRPILNAAASHR